MTGRFIAGSLAGQPLEQIPIPRLIQAFAEIDGESAQLLEAYLDRRSPAGVKTLRAMRVRGRAALRLRAR